MDNKKYCSRYLCWEKVDRTFCLTARKSFGYLYFISSFPLSLPGSHSLHVTNDDIAPIELVQEDDRASSNIRRKMYETSLLSNMPHKTQYLGV